jgi:hypothetical protein
MGNVIFVGNHDDGISFGMEFMEKFHDSIGSFGI